MKKLIIILAAAAMLAGCGNTVNHIYISDHSTATIENHEDGNTTSATPTTTLTGIPGVTQ